MFSETKGTAQTRGHSSQSKDNAKKKTLADDNGIIGALLDALFVSFIPSPRYSANAYRIGHLVHESMESFLALSFD